ncbi:MAG: CTP-dependent riboflavin kinase, partial [Thermoplasmata archaeon]|nr:CTP-dependent riboflavin kinase [Thermoplasmata archaeon]
LLGEYSAYQQIFFPVNTVEVGGVVVSGLGRGRYFMEMREYSESFSDVWGFRPYPGTLNIKVDEVDISKLSILRGREGVRIPGFTHEGRSFGDVLTFESVLRSQEGKAVSCVAVLPMKSRYNDVVEVVSRSNLRMSLGLEDGEHVMLEVKL